MATVNDLDWKVLLDSLERGNCVTLLGPDLTVKSVDPTPIKLITALSNRIASFLENQDNEKVDDPDDFPLVAQVFLNRHTRADLEVFVTSFYQEHHSALEQNTEKDVLFENLATLPLPLFVTSRHDQTLQHFLAASEKRPTTKSYNFRGGYQLPIGDCKSTEEPLVYHLFGSAADPRSLALTQRDLLELLEKIVSGTPGLPADLTNHFKERSFLFLGCGLHNYYLRILLHFLGLNRSGQRSFAPDEASHESIWFYKVEYRTLKLLSMDVTHFVQELRDRWDHRPPSTNGSLNPNPISPAVPSRPPPKVFISYVHEDLPAARDLTNALRENDIDPWLDRDNLRGGDNWETALENAIGREVDFFVLLLSKNLSDGVETYVHLEVERALHRKSRRGAVKFIYPIEIDDQARRLAALDRAKLQTQPIRDFGRDVPALAKDLRREYAKLQRR